jgi:hypothetical protein
MGVALLCVVESVLDDVRDVVVGESVGHLASAAHSFDKVGATQDSQVLAHQRLRQVQSIDELMNALVTVGQRTHQGHSYGGGKGSEQLTGLGIRRAVCPRGPGEWRIGWRR